MSLKPTLGPSCPMHNVVIATVVTDIASIIVRCWPMVSSSVLVPYSSAARTSATRRGCKLEVPRSIRRRARFESDRAKKIGVSRLALATDDQ